MESRRVFWAAPAISWEVFAMAKVLTQEDQDLRDLLVEHDGHQETVATILDISVNALSKRLQRDKHKAWWQAFKKKRSKRRKVLRHRRKYERLRQGTPAPAVALADPELADPRPWPLGPAGEGGPK